MAIDDFDVYTTRTFVNLLPQGINKLSGIQWMLEEIDIDPGECLGIGDGKDDLPF